MSGLRTFLGFEVDFIRNARAARIGAYVSPADFVLREGIDWVPAAYDPGRYGPPGPPRECYRNALMLASRFPRDLVYVEGYALSVIPVPHAWAAEISTGRVVDDTWSTVTPGIEYLGIPFDSSWVEETTRLTNRYGVIDAWEERWPLLQGPLDPAVVAAPFRSRYPLRAAT